MKCAVHLRSFFAVLSLLTSFNPVLAQPPLSVAAARNKSLRAVPIPFVVKMRRMATLAPSAPSLFTTPLGEGAAPATAEPYRAPSAPVISVVWGLFRDWLGSQKDLIGCSNHCAPHCTEKAITQQERAKRIDLPCLQRMVARIQFLRRLIFCGPQHPFRNAGKCQSKGPTRGEACGSSAAS